MSTERPPVIAVVISQLQPEVAVQVLLELPNDTNEAVLTRLANLEAVDADALASIDEYLSDRLIEYQRTLAGEEENQRRLSALLAAAPLALRDRWQAVVFPDKQPPKQASTSSGKSAEPPGTTAGLGAQEDILSDRGRSPASANMEPTEQDKTLYHRSSEASAIDEASISATTAHKQYILETGASSPIEEKNSARVTLPFPRTSQAMAPSQSIEFERILQLTPSQLASVLSRAGSRTVLLALAGATPQFMLRFDALLVP
ncbi:MAG: hypothetical protein KDA51_17105, partial [Planctomycetales bacterium]|nr:hypothetical protein [Planctomycetales bacterium]